MTKKPIFSFAAVLLAFFFSHTVLAGGYATFKQGGRYYDDDNQKYGDKSRYNAKYKLEKDYPAPHRRYSRQELDQARRRANNSTWMKYWGRKDPIYRSDQYRGRYSGGGYGYGYPGGYGRGW